MRRSHLITAAALGIASTLLLAISLSLYMERPSTLRVAVSSADSEDFELIGAAAKLAKHGRHAVRLKVVPADSAAGAAGALDRGDADLAVVRADIGMPDSGETVVLLHKDVALLVAPGGGEVAKIGDLAGKRIGIVSQHPGDGRVLETALAQYDIAADAVTTVPLRPEEVADAVTRKTVDAIFAVGLVSAGVVPATVRAVAKAGEGPPVFLPVAEAAAIAERQPGYESIEVVRGAFGGTPPRPAEEFDTLGVTYRLVASTHLGDNTVAALTRFLLSERVALAALAPVAQRMTAPSTDKGAALPVHPGTAAYIDDEEETFLDRYSDFIYIGAMALGVVASGLTAVVGRFGGGGGVPVEAFIARLLTILRQVRFAPRTALLEQYEREVDDIVAEALDASCLSNLGENKAAALTMAVDQTRVAIRDRRDALNRAGLLHANDDPATPFDPVLRSRVGDRGSSEFG